MKNYTALLLALILFACGGRKSQPEIENELVTPEFAKPEDAWVADRVSEAESRLTSTEGGEIVWKSIESHGGLSTWYSNGPIYFRFNYRPIGDAKIRDTYQLVDTWSAKARHQLASDPTIEYGWDGDSAWKYPPDGELAINPRFWSLSPYYFVGLPFVLSDEGVNLAYEGTTEYEGANHHLVRATFGEGVGDASDFYVLYINTETYRLAAIRYIVSFKGFFPDGGNTPEKLMTYEGAQTINGITLPEKHRTFMWVDNAVAEHVTNITVENVAFRPNTNSSYFEIPQGSYVMKGYME